MGYEAKKRHLSVCELENHQPPKTLDMYLAPKKSRPVSASRSLEVNC